ncbi:hypothetical protein PHYSODRAFT_285325 [Phytophthora sojae]|uniref:RxLR effector protein n=2 Tax=Phytophthora sojae TaxID=67593 RepID=G4Z8V4_PHYSP|nr:hypothetical protein PHYSODRAFT_285325 [Phytophthora sojae]AEK80892.1 Avh198 [Phytophthora sojae]AEK80893.1 Avh198 [Phytophthora sojae]AEK80894.1 Avh198 [Phytophthora sojae]EGZ19725.1 hypothetical protein PHYSODRAFT_285325 [Phytophthora sojae]|eukprot:XP_009522442.1 hypothetical protein PHYSODRAFT_285325 [Phytophthora sojae]
MRLSSVLFVAVVALLACGGGATATGFYQTKISHLAAAQSADAAIPEGSRLLRTVDEDSEERVNWAIPG